MVVVYGFLPQLGWDDDGGGGSIPVCEVILSIYGSDGNGDKFSSFSLVFNINDQIRYIHHTFPIVSVGCNEDYSGGNEIPYLYIYICKNRIPAYTLWFRPYAWWRLALFNSVLLVPVHQCTCTCHIGWTGKAPGLGI